MIHRDLCNPVNTKQYSPLRMQFHFLLSRYVCWDGLIPLTRKEMANLLGCNIQSINKFIKKGISENILSRQGNKLYFLKRVEQYSEGYVKHFSFLESNEFLSLSVHAQRFVLYTLWAGVHSGRPLKRELSTLYHSTKEFNGVLNLYSKDPIYSILEEVKKFLNLEITIQNQKEIVRISGLQKNYAKQEVLENQGEKELLSQILEKQGCDELLSENSCKEILKLKKHYFQKFQDIGIELFSHALQTLLVTHKLLDLNNRGQIGIYLKSILTDFEKKIVPTLQKRVEYMTQSISHAKDLLIHTKSQIVNKFQSELNRLTTILNQLNTIDNSTYNSRSFPFFNWLETK